MRRLAAVLVVALAAPASAAGKKAPAGGAAVQERKPSRRAMKEAEKRFRRGQALHEVGRYDEAIVEYQEAYKLSHLPAMLYNIGQVYRLKGDRRAAEDYYVRYVAASPDGRGVAKAREFLDAIHRELEAEAATLRETGDDETRGLSQGAALVPLLEPPAPAPLVITVPGPPATVDRGGTLRVAGLATGGAGVVVLGAGVFFGLQARSLSDELAGLGPGDEYDPQVVEDGHAANRNALICFSVGGAALLTGGVLYFLGARRAREPGVVLAPVVAPGVAGALLAGRW